MKVKFDMRRSLQTVPNIESYVRQLHGSLIIHMFTSYCFK